MLWTSNNLISPQSNSIINYTATHKKIKLQITKPHITHSLIKICGLKDQCVLRAVGLMACNYPNPAFGSKNGSLLTYWLDLFLRIMWILHLREFWKLFFSRCSVRFNSRFLQSNNPICFYVIQVFNSCSSTSVQLKDRVIKVQSFLRKICFQWYN